MDYTAVPGDAVVVLCCVPEDGLGVAVALRLYALRPPLVTVLGTVLTVVSPRTVLSRGLWARFCQSMCPRGRFLFTVLGALCGSESRRTLLMCYAGA